MTALQYFNILCEKSRAGEFPSWGETPSGNEGCLYQTPDGRGCAAAPLIKKYNSRMEDQTANGLIEDGLMEVPEGMVAGEVGACQATHDSMARAINRNNLPWDHNGFVGGLRFNVPAFRSFTDPTAAIAAERG